MSGANRTLSYAYDLNNNRTSITHPDGTAFTYAFDGLNRVKTVNEGTSTALLNINYATDGGRKSIVRTGGATTTYGLTTNSFAKDDGLHLKTFSQDFTGTANDLTTSFTFTSANQIDSVTKNNNLYYYQGNDDRAGTYKANGLNQYTIIAGQVLDQVTKNYDPNGNLINDGINTYSYDTENRLLNATTPNGTGSFVYDPNGRLFQSTINGTTIQYLYSGDALVAEYSGATVQRRYVHGDQVDEPLVQYNSNLIGVNYRRYLHTDHQGSIIAHSDSIGSVFASNGTLAYDAYGIAAAKNNSVQGAFGYTGQVYFPALGLNYYKARFYHPKLGRFLQTDPIGYKDDMDLYSYVGNDPMNKTDPTGLFEFDDCKMIGTGKYSCGTSGDDGSSKSKKKDAVVAGVKSDMRENKSNFGKSEYFAVIYMKGTTMKSAIVSGKETKVTTKQINAAYAAAKADGATKWIGEWHNHPTSGGSWSASKDDVSTANEAQGHIKNDVYRPFYSTPNLRLKEWDASKTDVNNANQTRIDHGNVDDDDE